MAQYSLKLFVAAYDAARCHASTHYLAATCDIASQDSSFERVDLPVNTSHEG